MEFFSPLDGIDTADFVIACDKGYAYIREYDLEPDLVVGDFDSYHGKITPGIEILDLPTMKDDTDTLAAIRYALEHDYKDLTLYCAFGGRFDHLMGECTGSHVCCVTRGRRAHGEPRYG